MSYVAAVGTRRSLACLMTVAWLAAFGSASAAALRPAAISSFFVTPKQPSFLRWKAEPGDAQDPLSYVLRDYEERLVASGQATATGDHVFEVPVNLAPGFYDIEFPATNQRFGIVAIATCQAEPPDPFFCIDSALSWLVHDQQLREGLVQVLRRNGVGMSRERLAWGAIQPARDSCQWETPARYESLRRHYQQQGIGVLEMFHDAPGWLGRVGKYPGDLVATSRAWQEIAARWRTTWGALEVWNEPDIFFGDNLPADQYVPLLRTIAYTLAEAKIDCPVVGGVFAHSSQAFLDTAARNGMLNDSDAVSFHTYGRALEMEALIAKYRGWLQTHARPTKPLWITECGRPWSRGPHRPPADQDGQSALDIAMKAVEARCGGIARYFCFVYPHFEENDNNFGMMGREATPLRSMAAYARLVSSLARKAYLGDLACDDPAVLRARVFGDDHSTVAVIYTGRPSANAKIRLGVPVLRQEGIDGRELTAEADGNLPIHDGLIYVWLDREKLGGRLMPETTAMRLWRLGQASAPPRSKPLPLVLRYEMDPQYVIAKSEGYRIRSETPGGVPLRVRVFNLSREQDASVTLQLSCAPARVLDPGERTLKVGREGSADAAWKVDFAGAFAATEHVEAVVQLRGEGIGPVAPLVIHLIRHQ